MKIYDYLYSLLVNYSQPAAAEYRWIPSHFLLLDILPFKSVHTRLVRILSLDLY